MNALRLVAALQDALPDTSFQRFVRGGPTTPPPLPDPVAKFFGLIFNAPAWMWVIAIGVGLVAAALVAQVVYKNRLALKAWFVAKDRVAKGAMFGAVGIMLALFAVAGTASWNYTQHDNDFCGSCHVMEGAWNKFASDAGKHSKLECHDCHQQSIYVSARQLVLWVANKPQEIPEHAPVPNQRCESCHNTKEDDMWTRVKETAGHRTHLESDSTALKDVKCVTCHGKEVHAFIPAKQTCGTSGCHENLQIKLGKMAEQTTLHCNQCHQFTAEVPLLATRDSAAGTMRPGKQECLACHEMQRVLTGYDASREPHNSTCGTCHNPHTQETPAAAGRTCTTSGCHANWEETPFHVGTNHRKATGTDGNCLTCHAPHASKVDPSDCAGCHANVREQRKGTARKLPPMPFDTTRALRLSSALHAAPDEPPARGKGDVRLPDLPPSDRPAALGQSAAPDSFPHRRHTALACITCHVDPDDTRGGRLTFETPRGCQICHHQAPKTNDCADCHATASLEPAREVVVRVAGPDRPPRERRVLFRHAEHRGRSCVSCHQVPVTLAPSAPAATCADCHADHHTAGRACAECHTTPQLREAHAKDVEASHQRCDACHAASTVARLVPDRSFCLTCHTPEQRAHYPARECTTCHQLTTPEGYRPKLVGGAKP